MSQGAGIIVRGSVQGVGFRPFVYRAARECGLRGTVRNGELGVEIEVDGERGSIDRFVSMIERDAPGRIAELQIHDRAVADFDRFCIEESRSEGRTSALIPDTAPCEPCLRELWDPTDRRFRYAFISCAACGPRYSIAYRAPYDRPNTSMVSFEPCEACLGEHDHPDDRRFHSQTHSCAECGPTLNVTEDPVRLLKNGGILALKGVGGFQLAALASSASALKRLRERKQRPQKPFALMVRDLETAKRLAVIDSLEERSLTSPAAPIVILRARDPMPGIAPGLIRLGLMLPSSPLHHLLLQDVGEPLVMTSGNRSEEPIAIDNEEAFENLDSLADGFLTHDREIVNRVDDSIVRIIGGQETVLRRARGYVPLPVPLLDNGERIVAYGGQWKSVIGAAVEGEAHLSAHLGDLESDRATTEFEHRVERLCEDVQPTLLACDPHPDYFPTRCAESAGVPLRRVFHHEAHVWSCLADNALRPPALGVAWDGTGLGPDGTIWGGEFLHLDARGRFTRVSHIEPFRLPGGDRAARDPRRSALGVLEASGASLEILRPLFEDEEWRLVGTQLRRDLNAPTCTSVGRLFDAAAILLGICETVRYEGQAAMMLEDAALHHPRARRFHEVLASWIVRVAQSVDCAQVLLTGGAFQNRLLTELAISGLRAVGKTPYWHRQVPPNDGGLALGQLVAARS